MSIVFNAEEIFEMAVDIEHNAAEFYKNAAGTAADEESRKMFLGFSTMEAEHARTFTQMKKELSREDKEPFTYDPDNEAVLYLQSMAQAHGWEGKASSANEFTGNENPEEVIDHALKAEEHSVAFYTGIKDIVFGKSGRENVEKIIREEMQHIRGLNTQLADLRS